MKHFKNYSLRMGAAFAVLIAAVMVLSLSATVLADTEPNDDFYDAEFTYDGAYETGTLDDSSDIYDYYEIYLFSGDTIDVTLTSMTNGLYLVLYMYNAAHSMVATPDSIPPVNTITYDVTSSGIYYLSVEAVTGSGSYMILTDVSSGSAPPQTGGDFEKTTPDSVPWTVGDYAASGGYLDLGAYIDTMKEQMMQNMPDDVKVSISGSGGIGQYLLVEYVGLDSGNYKFDYSCRIYGALAADGKMTANNVEIGGSSMDGTIKGNVDVTGDLLYEGSLWLGYYENSAGANAYWAAEKMTIDITASLDLTANIDADISAGGMSVTGTIDASATADIDLQLTLTSSPGIPFMPAMDKDLSVEKNCEVSYTGNAAFDMKVDMTVTGYFKTMMEDDFTVPEPVHYDGSASGSFTDSYALVYYAATNKATGPALLNGGWGLMMNVDELDLSGIGGTRGTDFETTATYDPAKGMYTTYDPYLGPADSLLSGVSLPIGDLPDTDSLTMTLNPATKEDAESFNDDPSAFLEAEGISMPGSSFPWMIILLVVVVIVVVVVLMVVMKKKTPPHHPQPYQPQPGSDQGGYQQPPPPPQQYPPQGQYPPPPPGQ